VAINTRGNAIVVPGRARISEQTAGKRCARKKRWADAQLELGGAAAYGELLAGPVDSWPPLRGTMRPEELE
jgi:hypothetical protein